MSRGQFRVAFSGDFFDAAGKLIFPSFDMSPLRQPGIDVVILPRSDRIEAGDMEEIDVLILLMTRFDRGSIPRSDRLALVARFGAGLDTVDVDALSQNGIGLVNTPEGVARSMAVATMSLILALTGNLLQKNAIGHGVAWEERIRHHGFGLVGRTLGSVGFGSIAREMFMLAKPFGMRPIATNRSGRLDGAAKLGVDIVDMDTVFRESDILTINCPLTTETRGLVDAGRLAQLKPTAYLVNLARGPIIDQAALVEALRNNRVAGAALDVLDEEPPRRDDPILSLDNIIITPHSLGWTDQLFAKCGAANVAAALAIRSGKPPLGMVDPRVVAHPTFRKRLKRHAVAQANS